MAEFNREELGSTLLGFLGFFVAGVALVVGMLPVWLVLLPIIAAAAVVVAAMALVSQLAGRGESR